VKEALDKIKSSGLTGRGGAGFPTWKKIEMVDLAEGNRKFVICNGSEGEPGVHKDEYILENYPERVVDGVRIAMTYLKYSQKGKRINVKGYLYLNTHLYRKYGQILRAIIHNDDIEIFHKPEKAGYIGGEESALLNIMEGKVAEPRLRPPFPVTNGLWDYPTLINNVETFYDISLVMHNQYEGKRFYTINGDVRNKGVYSFPANWTINQVLIQVNNHLLDLDKNGHKYDFFVQVGGDASGEILNNSQLNRVASGSASITVHSLIKHKPIKLLKKWVNFFFSESCGQCVPCREGTYRLNEFLKKKEIASASSLQVDWQLFFVILNSTKESSLCGLGGSVHVPIYSYIENVLKKYSAKELNMDEAQRKLIIDSFTNQ